jgi:hypothetical protein
LYLFWNLVSWLSDWLTSPGSKNNNFCINVLLLIWKFFNWLLRHQTLSNCLYQSKS